ncbi:glyceraldehyde 3-phosphate dehydrogenase NAD-binding domain-containing protein [Streptomyces albicerus]|uniref:glyceraldehyde 3-phosphate dehydrogenase NAD-binding domain-containing protein n=1 Tax=Streptomyces albicerus TaxID=2569859 RepID=UPI00124B0955|nr:glyceraldehyde 3-phosphate dehydrogenase NAD-binding domain-containing protein [Streptomyces albicerus]
MAVRVGITGFGRIGRNYLRGALDRAETGSRQVEAVATDMAPPRALAHLLEYDSLYGRISLKVEYDDTSITVDGQRIAVTAERDHAALGWSEHAGDVVMESTGHFRDRDSAAPHLKAGGRNVLISVPGKGGDVTVVMGVNEDAYDSAPIVSRDVIGDSASCVFDAALTQAHGDLVKVFGWYDNEWGSSNRLPDLTRYVAERL